VMRELTFESAMKSGSSFALNPDAFARGRRRMTEAEKAALVTHDDVLEYKREGAADWLVSCVPADLRDLMLGGDRAIAQCPDPAERDAALRELFMSRAGPDGSACGKVRRDSCDAYPSEGSLATARDVLSHRNHLDGAPRRYQGGLGGTDRLRSPCSRLAVGHGCRDRHARPPRHSYGRSRRARARTLAPPSAAR
jgi:hypothetical protein